MLILLRLEERLKGWDNGFGKWEEFLRYNFSSSKWYPYPFFYRLEGARVLDELSAMHGREFQLTDPYLFVLSATFLFL
jgi:hypothetical protein